MKITFRVLLGVFTYFAKVLVNIYTKFRLLCRHEYITDVGTLHFIVTRFTCFLSGPLYLIKCIQSQIFSRAFPSTKDTWAFKTKYCNLFGPPCSSTEKASPDRPSECPGPRSPACKRGCVRGIAALFSVARSSAQSSPFHPGGLGSRSQSVQTSHTGPPSLGLLLFFPKRRWGWRRHKSPNLSHCRSPSSPPKASARRPRLKDLHTFSDPLPFYTHRRGVHAGVGVVREKSEGVEGSELGRQGI